MKIECCFAFDMDKESASVLVSSGANAWCEIMSVNELFEKCASGDATRHQLRADLLGQALVIIEGGEYRHTSASL